MTTSMTGLSAFIESELHSGSCAPYIALISKSNSAQRWYVSAVSVISSGVTYSIKVRPTTDDDTGLKVLREPTWSPHKDGKTIIDIVAVHGLGAHPDDTWSKKRGEGGEARWVNWLEEEEMLPRVVPNARIMRYGYKSDWFGPSAIKQSARTTAERLLHALKRERKVVCDAYHDREEWPGIVDAVRGLVFFGTPFRGADGMSQSEMVQAAAGEYTEEDIEREPLHILDPSNELLQDMVDNFQKRVWVKMPHAQVACFFELQASEIGAIVGQQRRKAFAVNERSGCLDVSDRVSKHPLTRTHFNMNKFARPKEEDYLIVADVVEKMAGNALQPLSVPSAKAPPVVSVPVETSYEQADRRRVTYFRGRQEQLNRIDEYFSNAAADERRVLILQGMGGQGKTQIALKCCRQWSSRYAETFWLNASSEAMAVQSLERVAAEIGQPLTGIDDARTKIRLVVDALSQRAERWFMVLDNYDDPDQFATIEQFIPSDGLGDILITTRSRGLEALGKVLIVPPMTQQEGTELLLRDHPTTEVEFHKESCSKIVKRLGGLPLALDQAAAFIRYKQLRLDQLDEFLTLYDAQRKQVLQHTPRFWKYGTLQVDGKEEDNPAICAFTTWEMSFQQLEEDEARRRDIEHFFTVSAFLQPDHIGESLFRHHWDNWESAPAWMRIFSHEDFDRNECHQSPNLEGVCNSDLEGHPVALSESGSSAAGCETPMLSQIPWNADLFWDLISKAYDLSLLDSIADGASVDGSRFSLHPVICDWLQFRVGEESNHEFVCEAIEMVADSVRPMVRGVNHSLQARMILLGHVDTCIENYRRFSPNSRQLGQELSTCDVAGWFASFYRDQGRYRVGEGLCRQAYDTRRKTIGIEHASTLTIMNNLANLLIHQGKYGEAEEIHRETLTLKRKVLGEEHPKTLASMNNLASTLRDQGKYGEAEEVHRETLKLTRKVLGEEHPSTLTSTNNLAGMLHYQEKYEEAEEIYRETLKLSRKVLGEEHPSTLTRMNNLAITLRYQEKYEKAEEIHRETLKLSRKVLGEEHPSTLTSINNLAITLRYQGRYEEAEVINRETLKLRRKVLGEEHPSTLTSLHNLAYLLALRSRFVEATILYERAVAGFQRVLGTDHPTTRECVEGYSSMRNKARKGR
nr:hypothetical protein LTR18_005569 [Exophiala xenobiotica]